MSKKDNSKVTIANYLALIGLAGVGVVTFFGSWFHSSNGSQSGAIIGAVALVAGLSILLFLSIKAKSAEDDVDKWRYVEWACLAAFVAVAIIFSKPFLRFFYVVSEKQELQELAKSEVESINNLYTAFNKQCVKKVGIAHDGMDNYDKSRQSDVSLNLYIEEHVKDKDKWQETALEVINSDTMFLNEMKTIKNRVDEWRLQDLPSLATDLENKCNSVTDEIKERIEDWKNNSHIIPKIVGNGKEEDPYRMDGYCSFEDYDLPAAPEALFAKKLNEANGSSVLGWVVYVAVLLLVLLNYFLTERSMIVKPKRGGETLGGTDL